MTLIEVSIVILGVTGWLLLLLVALTALMLIGSIAYAVIKKDAVYGSIGVAVVVVAVLCMIVGFDWKIMHILTGLFHFTLDYGWIVLLLMLVGAFAVQHKHRSKTTKLIVVLLIVALILRIFAGYVQYEKAEPQRLLAERKKNDMVAEKQNAMDRKAFAAKLSVYEEKFNGLCKTAGYYVYRKVPKQDSILAMTPFYPDRNNPQRDLYRDHTASPDLDLQTDNTTSLDALLLPDFKCVPQEYTAEDKKRKSAYEERAAYFKAVERENTSADGTRQFMRFSAVEPTYGLPAFDYHKRCLRTSARGLDYKLEKQDIDRPVSEYGYRIEPLKGVDSEENLHSGGGSFRQEGSRLQIVHIPTGEVIAERISYRLEYRPPFGKVVRKYCPNAQITDNQFIAHVLSTRQPDVERVLVTNESR